VSSMGLAETWLTDAEGIPKVRDDDEQEEHDFRGRPVRSDEKQGEDKDIGRRITSKGHGTCWSAVYDDDVKVLAEVT